VADQRGDRSPYASAQLLTGWALTNRAWVDGELSLLGRDDAETLREWLDTRLALMVRFYSTPFVSPREILDKHEERAKLWLIDEESWGTGADAAAGQAGLAALINQQPTP
jgi:hypothetical protein